MLRWLALISRHLPPKCCSEEMMSSWAQSHSICMCSWVPPAQHHDCPPPNPHSKQSVSSAFNAHFYHKNCPHQHSQLRYCCGVFPVWMQRGCRMLAARDESEKLELGWREWGGRAGRRTFKRTGEKWIKQNERKTQELGLSHEAQSSFFILLCFGLKCWYDFRGWG